MAETSLLFLSAMPGEWRLARVADGDRPAGPGLGGCGGLLPQLGGEELFPGPAVTLVAFTISGTKIVAIDLTDDPRRIAEADLAIIGAR